MADNEINLNLNLQKEIDEVKRLQQEFKNLKAIAEDSVASFRSGSVSAAQVRQNINAAASAGTGGVQGSASSVTSGGATNASTLAAASVQGRPAEVASLAQFQKQSSGLGYVATPGASQQAQPFHTTQAQVNLAQSAMSQSSSAIAPPMSVGSGGSHPIPIFQTGTNGTRGFDPNRTVAFDAPAAMKQRAEDFQANLAKQAALRQAFGHTALNAAASAISAGFNISADQTVSGHVNPTSIGSGIGTTIGTGVGALIGAIGGPPGILLGAGIGSMIGSSVGNYLAAPIQKGYEIYSALAPTAGLISGGAYGPGMHAASQWAQNISMRIHNLGDPQSEGRQDVSAQSLAAGYASISQALIAGGTNPFQQVDVQVGAPRLPYLPGVPLLPPNGDDSITKSLNRIFPGTGKIQGSGYTTGRSIENLARSGINAISAVENRRRAKINDVSDSVDGQPENLGQSISSRIHTLYPDEKTANAILERIGGVYGALPETGGNMVDMLMRHGALSTYQAYQGLRTPPVSWEKLMETSANFRAAGRLGQLGSMRARGSAQASADALEVQMGIAKSLPGGENSLTYAQAQAGYRAATLNAFEQENLTSYATPMARLQGQIAIANVMPYAPGQVFGLQAQAIRGNLSQSRRIGAFISQRRAAGMLSEEEEYSLTSQQSSLQVAAMQGIAEIAEGGPNLLPGIAATGIFGSGLHRFTSMQQAALFLGRYGSPRRSAGAYSGRQAAMQRDFYDSFGFNAGPHSRSELTNNGRPGESEHILRDILNELQKLNGRNAGSFPTSNRDPRDLPPSGTGSGGRFN